MDDSGSVNNLSYQRFWNWGGTIYWAVQEGQGRIGWSGVVNAFASIGLESSPLVTR